MRSRRRRQRVQYGYKLTDTGKEVECPEAQAVIDRIVREYWSDFGFDAIAKNLTKDGVPAPRGGDKWHGSGVQRVWHGVTNGRMARIEKEDEKAKKAEQEAYHASEAGQMAAEIQRRQKPEVQLERKGDVEMDNSIVNVHTGATIKEGTRTFTKPEWDLFEERRLAEEQAYKDLTRRPRADAHRWRNPGRVEAGKSLKGVDQVVMRQANRAADEANHWLDLLVKDAGEHQSTYKRKVRVAVKLLIEELAIARQATLHYQQRAEKAEKASS